MSKKKRKGFSINEAGVAVHLWKRTGATYTCRFRIEGVRKSRNTGETSKDRAKARAREIVREELRNELLDLKPGPTLTWGQLFSAYFRDKVPTMRKQWGKASHARRDMLESCLGGHTVVADLDQADVDRYAHLRTTGTLFPSGNNRRTRAVSSGTVESEIRWLNSVLRWAMHRRVGGERLLTSNPLDGLTRPKKNENPRRPNTSETRYRKTRDAADLIDPRGRIRAMLAIARYTGRRIGSICALKASDVLWKPGDVEKAIAALGQDVRLAEHYPNGAIRWSENHDKLGVSWITPISPDLRLELDRYQARSPAIGDTPLLPAPRKAAAHFRPDIAGKWLVRAEKQAGLPHLSGGRWHCYRRLFATELAHVPAKVAAMLGGWKSVATMQRLYQQPTGVDLYAAATQVGRTGPWVDQTG